MLFSYAFFGKNGKFFFLCQGGLAPWNRPVRGGLSPPHSQLGAPPQGSEFIRIEFPQPFVYRITLKDWPGGEVRVWRRLTMWGCRMFYFSRNLNKSGWHFSAFECCCGWLELKLMFGVKYIYILVWSAFGKVGYTTRLNKT